MGSEMCIRDRLYGLTPVFAEKIKRKEGKIYLGQIIHSGDWNPHPSALGKLLKKVSETIKTSVYLEPIYVDLKKDNLDDIPILYITGHFNPRFSEGELKKLRKFLLSGGSLIADSCCGSAEFTESFRSIMKKILPEAKVEKYNTDHILYQIPFKIEKFFYTFPHKNTPPLEVYTLNGVVCAVFSPYGLGGGWEGIPRPYTFDIESTQSLKIGVNIIAYLMTH